LVIYGDGRQSRDFVHVKDVVEANLLALENKKATGESLNVGTGKSRSVNELAEMLLKLIDRKGARIIHEKARPGDIRHSYADTTKTKRILGFSATHAIEDELPELIK
jgi:UDP-glucose 4-epimerase